MAIPLYGDPNNLQGGEANLQGSSPQLQPAASPGGVYGPVPPVSTPAATPAAPSPVFYRPDLNSQQVYDSSNRPLSYDQYIAAGGKPDFSNVINKPVPGGTPATPAPAPTAPGPAYNGPYSSSASFYKPDPNSQQVYDASGKPLSFSQYIAAGGRPDFSNVINGPIPTRAAAASYTPGGAPGASAPPGEALAGGAGAANLSPQDLINLIQQSTQLTPDQIKAIQDSLGIPAAQQAAFAQPTQTTVDFYNAAYANAGLPDVVTKIESLNDQINQINQEFTNATAQVNENPFLDEASRVGRISRLQDKAQSTIGNLVNEQTQLQQLYQNGVAQVENLTQAHTADFATQTAQNQAKLNFLLQQAINLGTAQVAANQQQTYRYLPQYLQSKVTATPPETVTSPQTGAVFKYNPTSGQFDMVSSGTGQFTVNPLTGAPYSQVTGQGLGLGSFPTGAATPGSAAAVNNPLGIKPGGVFAQYATASDGFHAGVQLVQSYQSGTGPKGINGGSTLDQFVKTWITGDPNSSTKTGYNSANVAQYLQQLGMPNATQYTPIGQIDPTMLATAVAHFETGYNPGSPSGGMSQTLQGFVRQLPTGQQYVDLTNVPTALQAAITTAANTAGIPALAKEDVDKLVAIQDSRTNLGNITTSVGKFLSPDWLTRDLGGAVGNKVSEFLQSNTDISSFNAWRTAIINNVQALAGGTGSGLRINQAEIDTAMKNDLPQITDTLGTAKQKIATLTSQLNNWQSLIFQTNTPAGALPQGTSTNSDPLGIFP